MTYFRAFLQSFPLWCGCSTCAASKMDEATEADRVFRSPFFSHSTSLYLKHPLLNLVSPNVTSKASLRVFRSPVAVMIFKIKEGTKSAGRN